MVVNPAAMPVVLANSGCVGTFSDLLASVNTSRPIVRITISAITLRNTASSRSLPVYTPIRMPSTIHGISLRKCCHCA